MGGSSPAGGKGLSAVSKIFSFIVEMGRYLMAKREKYWVLGWPPSEVNAGSSPSETNTGFAAKRDKCWARRQAR